MARAGVDETIRGVTWPNGWNDRFRDLAEMYARFGSSSPVAAVVELLPKAVRQVPE